MTRTMRRMSIKEVDMVKKKITDIREPYIKMGRFPIDVAVRRISRWPTYTYQETR